MALNTVKGQYSSMDLIAEQEKTLGSEPLQYGLMSRLLFWMMDVMYGKNRSLSKFKVLEVIARVPYQAWENVAYVAITHTYRAPDFARRIFEFVKESRDQQDNEQWHLLILEELVHKKGIQEGFIRHRVIPQIIAFFYYHISWILYVVNPKLSYRLNAHFEDHAEREYMKYAAENKALADEKYQGDFSREYGTFDTLSDLFRKMGVDERHHKEQSLQRIAHARF